MKKLFVNIAVLCCSVLFFLLMAEGVVRIFYSRFSNYNLEMWRYAVELKQPLPYDDLPFHHHPNKDGMYYGAYIRTNSLGFRGEDFPKQKEQGKERILFLGDSFTLGWGVHEDSTFSTHLENMLNARTDKAQVINLGTCNYNSTMAVELFKLKGLELKPDKVILMYFVNDAEPVPEKKKAVVYGVKKHSYLGAFLFDRFTKIQAKYDESFDWRNYYKAMYADESASLEQNNRSMVELFDICRERNIELLVVSIPELRVFDDYPFDYVTAYLKELCREKQVDFLDLLPALSKEEPASLWVSMEDFHANEKANFIIAKEIFNKLSQTL